MTAIRAVGVVFLVFLLPGCGEKDLTWKEDARLPDSRIVTIDRHQDFRDRNHDPGDYWLRFKSPDTGELIEWRSDRDLAPVVLYFRDRVPFLLVSPKWGISLDRYRCPNPSYLLFRFAAGRWTQVALDEVPRAVLKANVIYSVYDYVDVIKANGKHLSAAITGAQTRMNRPWEIDFTDFKNQTFGVCGVEPNYLLRK